MPAPPLSVAPALNCADLVRHGRITEALENLASRPDPTPEDLAISLECRLARGEMDLAIGLGERLAGTQDARATLALGELAAATGHDDDAVILFRAVGEITDDPEELPWRAGAALGLMRTGGRREAAELATTHLALTRASDSAYAVAGALRTAATCLMVDRADRLREAHGLARESFDRLAAQVGTDLAGLIALTPAADAERDEAVALLRAAEEYADAEDLWPLHTRVRRLLERFGESAHTPRAESIARLTESELRVARLAALGGTNRAIADDVGVTVKAVEWHLSHAYRKLGVRGRAELPRALRLA